MKRSLISVVMAVCIWSGNAWGQTCTPGEDEKQIWDGIKGSDEPREFLSYLRQFPKGCFRALANFKIKSLVDESLPLTVSGLFAAVPEPGGWRVRKERQMVTEGDLRPVEWIRIRPGPTDPNKFALEYQCDGAGVGVSPWVLGDQLCPQARAPIQGFSVRMRGYLKDFFDLEVFCSTTLTPGNVHGSDQTVGDEQWCGVHGGTPRTYIGQFSITVKRKKFED